MDIISFCNNKIKSILKHSSLHSPQNFKSYCKSWIKTFVLACKVFREKAILSRDIPALTYSTFMALTPFMAFMFVIARGFGYDNVLETWLNDTLEAQPVVVEYIVGFVHNYLSNIKSQYIVGAGLLMMLYTLYSLMQNIEIAFNNIWSVKSRSLRKRLTDYTSIFFFFGLMIMCTSALHIFASDVKGWIDSFTHWNVSPLFLYFIAIITLYFFFVFVYIFIPNTYIKVKNTLVPSLLSAFAMVIFQYFYIHFQIKLSSYNVVYGSLAALPLFMMWLQYSWAICMFFAVLCYTNQTLHHYDNGVEYKNLNRNKRLKICAAVMKHVCMRFENGKNEYSSAFKIQEDTKIPQQLVNSAIDELVKAKLIVEVVDNKNGSWEDMVKILPSQNTNELTYGKMIEMIDLSGENVELESINDDNSIPWKRVESIKNEYINGGKEILLSDLFKFRKFLNSPFLVHKSV